MAEDPPQPAPVGEDPRPGPGAAGASPLPGGALRGLAGERTSLAWTRTVLAVIVAGALLLRSGAGLGGIGELPGGATIAAGLLLLVATLRRGPGPASHRLLRAIGMGVTVLCLASLALTFTQM